MLRSVCIANRKEKEQHSTTQWSHVLYSIDSIDSCGIADNLMQSQDGMVIMNTRSDKPPS